MSSKPPPFFLPSHNLRSFLPSDGSFPRPLALSLPSLFPLTSDSRSLSTPSTADLNCSVDHSFSPSNVLYLPLIDRSRFYSPRHFVQTDVRCRFSTAQRPRQRTDRTMTQITIFVLAVFVASDEFSEGVFPRMVRIFAPSLAVSNFITQRPKIY